MSETAENRDVADQGASDVQALGGNVTVLERDGRRFYVVGTAHVSEQSVHEVERVIRAVKPDTVAVELCEARYNALTDDSRWQKLDIFQVIREGKTLFLLANLAIGAYQRRLGAKLGVKPGAELLAGIRTAEDIGAHVELVDRDIHVTLKRTWANVKFTQKFALLGAILESLFARNKHDEEHIDIEALKEQVHLSEMLAEFSRALPGVKVPLIDERDAFLMSSIEDAPGETVVAVVGAAHVPGMQGFFGKPVDRASISELPAKKPWVGLLKFVIPAIILAAFVIGWQRNEFHGFKEMLTAWVLPNSIFCALLTALAGGTLVSVLTGFVASPITSLNPLLGAGMVVGLMEAWRRRPTVQDAERINDDVQSIRGIYRNPFTRVLLVTVASTLGSAMGAWVGLGWVLSLLA